MGYIGYNIGWLLDYPEETRSISFLFSTSQMGGGVWILGMRKGDHQLDLRVSRFELRGWRRTVEAEAVLPSLDHKCQGLVARAAFADAHHPAAARS